MLYDGSPRYEGRNNHYNSPKDDVPIPDNWEWKFLQVLCGIIVASTVAVAAYCLITSECERPKLVKATRYTLDSRVIEADKAMSEEKKEIK